MLCVPKMLDFSVCGAEGSGAPQQWVLFAKSGVFLAVASAELSGGPDRCFLRAVDMCFSLDRGKFRKYFPRDCNTLSSLSKQEQYHFCYDIALEYLESLESR